MKCRKNHFFEKSTLLWAIVAVLFISFSERSFASVNEVNEVAAISQQGRTVTGRIVDATGEPVIGATIIEVGSSPINGTITNFDGEYTLVLTTANPALNISFIGFLEITENVGARSIVNIILEEYVSFLDEVVVVGYGTMRRRDLTGAVATVRAEDILRESPRSVQDVLRGSVAGLSMGFGTGAAGTSTMLLRGDNRLLTDAQRNAGRTSEPLIVLDGVIWQGALSDINPQDIASIDILKDASSAAVFGARAASGVIVIMTQRGARGGRPQISVNSTVGVVQAASLREILSPEGFLEKRRAFNLYTGRHTDDFLARHPGMFDDPRRLPAGVDQLTWINYGRAANNQLTTFTEEDLLRTWGSRLMLTTTEVDNFIRGRTTNWQDEIFQLGFQQDHHISVSHRTDDVSYFWSMSFSDREGIIVDDRFQRFATRLNLESTITSFLRVGIHAGFSTRDNSFLNQSGGRHDAMRGMQTVISPFGVNEIGNPDVPLNIQRLPTGSPTEVNEFFDNQFRTRRDRLNTFDANVFAVVTLPFNIEYQVNFVPYYHRRDWMNHESSDNPQWSGIGGRAERRHWETFSWHVDNILRYSQRFGIHNIEATFLYNIEKRERWQSRLQGTGFLPSDVLGFHRMQAATNFEHFYSSDDVQTGDALMGRIFYSLMDRYMITASIRRDGFSAFGMNNPHAVFPAISGAWTFTSENFAQSFHHIMDFGRLRLSWGENGNRDVGMYDALLDLVTNPHPVLGSGGYILQMRMRAARMANPDLRWERTASTNLGLDFSLLNNMVSGSFEAFTSTTTDLLMRRELPTVTGHYWVTSNMGELRTRGFEATLNVRPVSNQNFTWRTSGNFSLYRREIISLFGDMVDIFDANGNVIGQREANDYVNEWFIGQAPDRIWDFKRAGVWQIEEREEAARLGLQPGDFKYLDLDGSGVMGMNNRTFLGYRTPRFRWAWRNDFTFFRDFTASTTVYSAWGWYRTFNAAANAPSFPDRQSQFAQPFWTPENRINDFARLGSRNIGNNWVNASFIRFDNITLSYNVPRAVVQRASIQNMRITAGIRNVAIWSPHWHWHDAETAVPTPRTYSVSLNFTL